MHLNEKIAKTHAGRGDKIHMSRRELQEWQKEAFALRKRIYELEGLLRDSDGTFSSPIQLDYGEHDYRLNIAPSILSYAQPGYVEMLERQITAFVMRAMREFHTDRASSWNRVALLK